MKKLVIVLVMLLSTSVHAYGGEVSEDRGYPKEIQRIYIDSKGLEHKYLVQEPESLEEGEILIYMHGAAGQEEQGMDPELYDATFKRLRLIMNQRNWIYVCPRDPELKGLLDDLKSRYGNKKIFLAGASAGAIYALDESVKNPDAYSGVILLCPALWDPKLNFPEEHLLTMPSWIVAGSKDRGNIKGTQRLVNLLKILGRPYHYVEIPDGGHDAPLEKVEWAKALEFIQNEVVENEKELEAKSYTVESAVDGVINKDSPEEKILLRWRNCDLDTDCFVISTHCEGGGVSVNKTYKKEAFEYLLSIKAVKLCYGTLPSPSPRCVNNLCEPQDFWSSTVKSDAQEIVEEIVHDETYTVERVIDGDTLKLTNGEVVKLIGIKAPPVDIEEAKKEVMATGQDLETITKMGQEAKDYIGGGGKFKGLLGDEQKVQLEFDVQERDKYGRLLAYVWVYNKEPSSAMENTSDECKRLIAVSDESEKLIHHEINTVLYEPTKYKEIIEEFSSYEINPECKYYVGKLFLNAFMIVAGYAQPMTIPPNVKYADLFQELYEEARENKRGLWKEDYSCKQDSDCHIVTSYEQPRGDLPGETLITCFHQDKPLSDGEWLAEYNEYSQNKCQCDNNQCRLVGCCSLVPNIAEGPRGRSNHAWTTSRFAHFCMFCRFLQM